METFVDNIVVRNANARAQLYEIWDEARQGGLTEENMMAFIDSLEQALNQSQQLNFTRWPIMNTYVHQNPVLWGSYKAEVQNVRRFMKERIAWMDNKLGYVYTPNNIADTHIDFYQPYQVYNLQGRVCGDKLEGLASGIYVVRQGRAVRKVTISDKN